MEKNGIFRPRASTLPSRIINKSRKSSETSRGSNDSVHSLTERKTGSLDKLHMDPLPNGYSLDGPRRKPKAVNRLAVPSQDSGPRRRATAINAPSQTGLLRPPSDDARTRRRSAPAFNSNSPRPGRKSGVKQPTIKIDSPTQGSPRTAWDSLDAEFRYGIEREPLPGGSPEFKKCMSLLEDDLDINQNKPKPKPKRPQRLSAEFHPRTIQKHKSPSPSPKTARRVTWK